MNAAPNPSGWTGRELGGNPHDDPSKAERVRSMFASIAPTYDLNNRIHSFGLDQRWRRRAVSLCRIAPGDRALDVACGTGDLSRLLARSGATSVTGVDFTPQMLDLARAHRHEGAPIDYRWGDAMALEFPDASFEVLTIAFGLRNVTDPARAVHEFRRVLRKGGRAVILEFSEPRHALVRACSRFYTHRIMPWSAALIARDRSGAYRYLPRSVDTFLGPAELAELMRRCGFSDVHSTPLTFGVCTVTSGTA